MKFPRFPWIWPFPGETVQFFVSFERTTMELLYPQPTMVLSEVGAPAWSPVGFAFPEHRNCVCGLMDPLCKYLCSLMVPHWPLVIMFYPAPTEWNQVLLKGRISPETVMPNGISDIFLFWCNRIPFVYYQWVGFGSFGCIFSVLFLYTIRKVYISSILAILPVVLHLSSPEWLSTNCQIILPMPYSSFFFFFLGGWHCMHSINTSRQDLTASGVSRWVQARLDASEILQGVELWIAGSSCISWLVKSPQCHTVVSLLSPKALVLAYLVFLQHYSQSRG